MAANRSSHTSRHDADRDQENAPNAVPNLVSVDGVDLHPDWGVIRAIYGRKPKKWHLGTYECESSLCGRGWGSWYGFEECEPLSSINPDELCRSCVAYVRAHNVQMAES